MTCLAFTECLRSGVVDVNGGDVADAGTSVAASELWPRGALTALCIAVTAPAVAAALALRIARHSRSAFLAAGVVRAHRLGSARSARVDAEKCDVWLAMVNDAHAATASAHAQPAGDGDDGGASAGAGAGKAGMNTGIDNADRVRSSVALRTLVHNAAQMAEPLFRRRSAALRVCA